LQAVSESHYFRAVNVDQLLQLYAADERLTEISRQMAAGNGSGMRIHLRNLRGASGSVIAASLILQSNLPYIFLAADQEEAAYLQKKMCCCWLIHSANRVYLPNTATAAFSFVLK
jgi:hypothetical protein